MLATFSLRDFPGTIHSWLESLRTALGLSCEEVSSAATVRATLPAPIAPAVTRALLRKSLRCIAVPFNRSGENVIDNRGNGGFVQKALLRGGCENDIHGERVALAESKRAV